MHFQEGSVRRLKGLNDFLSIIYKSSTRYLSVWVRNSSKEEAAKRMGAVH